MGVDQGRAALGQGCCFALARRAARAPVVERSAPDRQGRIASIAAEPAGDRVGIAPLVDVPLAFDSLAVFDDQLLIRGDDCRHGQRL